VLRDKLLRAGTCAHMLRAGPHLLRADPHLLWPRPNLLCTGCHGRRRGWCDRCSPSSTG
jgi:hypothetical protein